VAPKAKQGASATTRLPPKRFAPPAGGDAVAASTSEPATTPAKPSGQPSPAAKPAAQPASASEDLAPQPIDQDAPRTARSSTTSDLDPDGDGEAWGIVLQTFSQDDHAARAQSALKSIRSRWPQLEGAYVRQVGGGSAVLIGTFSGPTDPRAKQQLEQAKQIVDGRARPFALAMLTRFEADPGTMGQFDLRRARERFPNQNPLYSVQVAVWSDLGSGELSLAEVKQRAEAYCKQLRTRGIEAYVFHDGGTKTSSVCVGVFGKDAYDPRSTLYSAEVEAVLRRFPKHLVNGEPLMLPYDKSDPSKLRAQPPTLVEVPK
jgi:cell division septation protein DedD